jgi:uncharacterized protein Yka (UPF0111/DUF47 family)
MKGITQTLSLAKWLLFSKHEKAKQQILNYAQHTIKAAEYVAEHTELNASYDPETKKITGGVRFKQELD